MRSGPCNKWVSLARCATTSGEGPFTALSPASIWAAIEPLPPGYTDGQRSVTHTVRMRYHPQVTMDTRIQYVDARISQTRSLFVRGVQSVNEAGDELRLLAEEIQP